MRRLLATLLLALSLVLAPGAAAHAQARDGSLEAFLKRLRTEREAEQERLRPMVEELVQRLGRSRTASETKKVHADLDALGSEAAPLLVPYLDPGPSPKPEQEKEAQEVAAWLARTKNGALFDDLVRLAHGGSPLARRLALHLLGESPETERAIAALHALYPDVSGALCAECVRSLAQLASGDPLIVSSLSDTHPEVVGAGVRALVSEPRKKPRPEIVALLSDPNRGADVLPELVDYFCFPGQELDEDIVSSLLRFATREDLQSEARMKVLEGLPRFGVSLSSRLRREMEPLLGSTDSGLKEAALIALTLMKDSKARRDLLRFYDDQVQNNPNWPLAYQKRGDVLLKIGEYRDAARDYQDAIRLHGDSAKLPGNRELWINLARAYVKDNKLKAAADALEDFGMSSELRRLVKADPDFQPLVEHPKYKSLFD